MPLGWCLFGPESLKRWLAPMGWQFQTSAAPALLGRSYEEETADGVEDEPRVDTKSDGVPWLRRRQGMKPTRERGRPARTTFARPHPTPRLCSTGNGAGTLLRPSPCRCRRQGGRVPHRRETERHATAVHAGETPALPGGPTCDHYLLLPGGAPACRAPHRGETARHATAVHAGETPALPGGTSSYYSCCSQGRGGLPVAPSQETERHVAGVHAGGTLALPGGPPSYHSCCSRGGALACRVPHPGKLSVTQRGCMRAGRPRSRGALPPVTAFRSTPVPVGRVR